MSAPSGAAPEGTPSLVQLLADICAFFDEYAFVYDFSNVRIVNESRLNGFPEEWRAWFRSQYDADRGFTTLKRLLSDEPAAGAEEEAAAAVPASLADFCERRVELLRRARGYIARAAPAAAVCGEVAPVSPKHVDLAHDEGGDACEGDRIQAMLAARAREGRGTDADAAAVGAAAGDAVPPTEVTWETVIANAHARLPAHMNAQSINVRMRPKKIHEVNRMAAFIVARCAERGVTHVIDIGGGVGHLCRMLKTVYGLQVTVLEGDAAICATAVRDFGMKAINMYITEDTWEEVVRVISEVADRVAIVGLHCCGDLSVTILKLYAALRESVKLLCLAPCCYHKMKRVEHSVPLSTAMRSWCEAHPPKNAPLAGVANDDDNDDEAPARTSGKRKPDPYAREATFTRVAPAQSPFLLRLAAQEAFLQWAGMDAEGHQQHMRAFGYRAVLEDIVRRERVTMKKKKRHTQHTGQRMMLAEGTGFPLWVADNFDVAADAAADADTAPSVADLMQVYIHRHAASFPLLESVAGVQQSVRELALSWLVLDRLLYLSEQASIDEVAVYNLFDEDISAMNKVLVGMRG